MTQSSLRQIVERIDPERAGFYLQCLFERQRRRRARKIAQLVNVMQRGLFVALSPIQMCELDGQLIVVNGQHTLEAIKLSGVTLELPIIVKRVANRAEIAHIYSVLDTNAARSAKDRVRAYDLGKSFTCSERMLESYDGAMGLIITGLATPMGAGRLDPAIQDAQVRSEAMLEYKPHFERYCAAVAPASEKWRHLFLRRSVMAPALETFRYCPERAPSFWTAAAADDGLTIGEPAKVLLDELKTTRSAGTPLGDQLMIVALCWNKHFEYETLERLRRPARWRFFLAGTPWTADGGRPQPLASVVRAQPPQLVDGTAARIKTGVGHRGGRTYPMAIVDKP